MIGFCGLKYLDDLNAVDIGYRFLPEYWGRGLATEACLASVTFGFEVLKLDLIIGLYASAEHCGWQGAGRRPMIAAVNHSLE